ncbi:MAG TPA: hypothetical protein VHM70_09255 [Polyangiaceae bacterium]|nr:hypothetical protein [Polyangiaceae bacterium]
MSQPIEKGPAPTAGAADQAAHERAARFDLDWATLRVHGSDRVRWLNGLVTCDVNKVNTREGIWGLALNRLGKIQSPLWIVVSLEGLLLGLPRAHAAALLQQFDRMLVMEDAEIEDVSSAYRWAFVIGPETPTIATALAAENVASGKLDLFGLGGVAVAQSAEVEAKALEPLPKLDASAWRRLCLERDVPEFDGDYGSSDRPHEAALERRAVDWQKGCYLGQEVVCMQDMRGKVSRRLRRVLVAGEPETRPGGELRALEGEARFGRFERAAYSERAGGWLAFVNLPEPVPTGLALFEDGAPRPARIVESIY